MIEFAKHEPRINNERVFILGRSLGGAVATHTGAVIAEDESTIVKGIILENTFTSVSKIADNLFGFLRLIPSIKQKMLRLQWDSEAEISKVKAPILFVSGEVDQLSKIFLHFFQKIKNPKILVTVPSQDDARAEKCCNKS